jgi:hypothetical protein
MKRISSDPAPVLTVSDLARYLKVKSTVYRLLKAVASVLMVGSISTLGRGARPCWMPRRRSTTAPNGEPSPVRLRACHFWRSREVGSGWHSVRSDGGG